jgi:hypothetical protein
MSQLTNGDENELLLCYSPIQPSYDWHIWLFYFTCQN